MQPRMFRNSPSKWEKHQNQVIQSDLFGMVKWPFQGLSDLQLGDKKVTAWIFNRDSCRPFYCWAPQAFGAGAAAQNLTGQCDLPRIFHQQKSTCEFRKKNKQTQIASGKLIGFSLFEFQNNLMILLHNFKNSFPLFE